MFMTYVEFPAKRVLTLMYWRHGALIERAWQQSEDAPDWEPHDPHILRVAGMKGGLVKVFEGTSNEL
jgi:hypothetical protein